MWTLPWASSSGGRRCGGPAEGPSRSRGRKHASSVESWGGGAHLRWVPWNYRASEPWSREQGVGGLRGVDAGQEWGLAGVELQRGDGSTVTQRSGTARGKSGADGRRAQGRGAPDKRGARGSRRAGRAGDLRRGLRSPLPGGISAGTMGPTSGPVGQGLSERARREQAVKRFALRGLNGREAGHAGRGCAGWAVGPPGNELGRCWKLGCGG